MTTEQTTAQSEQPRTVVAELREYLEDAARGIDGDITVLIGYASPRASDAIREEWEANIARLNSLKNGSGEVTRFHCSWRVQILTAAIRRAVVTRWEDGS